MFTEARGEHVVPGIFIAFNNCKAQRVNGTLPC